MSTGQIVGGVIGAAIGFYFGNVQGAAIGWSIGSYAGGAIDPVKVTGPRIADPKLQDSVYGRPLPRIWGTMRTAGNLAWEDGLHETESDDSGKGGGGGPNDTFSYSASFAIRLCHCPNKPVFGIGKVWWNSRLVDIQTLPITVYLGTSTQDPDPTMEAVLGIGNVPAWRNVCYVVFTGMNLAAGQNTIGLWEFEVITNQHLDAQRVSTMDPEPWVPLNGGDQNYADNPSVSYDGVGDTVTVATSWGGQLSGPRLDGQDRIWGKGSSLTGFSSGFHRRLKVVSPDGEIVTDTVDYFPDGPYVSHVETGFRIPCKNDPSWWYDQVNEGAYSRSDSHPSQHAWGQLWRNGNVVDPFGDFYAIAVPFVVFNGVVFALGSHTAPGHLGAYKGTLANPAALYNLDSAGDQYTVAVATDGTLWVANSSEGMLHLRYDGDKAFELIESFPDYTDPGPNNGLKQFGFFCGEYVAYKGATVDTSGHILVAKASGTQPWPVLADIPYSPGVATAQVGPIYTLFNGSGLGGIANGQGLAWVPDGILSICVAQTDKVSVADILADISANDAHLDEGEFDVSGVPDLTWGYGVFQQMIAKNACQQLLDFYFIRTAERDGKIVFIKLGGEPVVTIPDDDLAAHVYGTDPPPLAETVRVDEPQLPRSVTVGYFNHGADYQIGSQPAKRQTSLSQLDLATTFAIVADDDEAARVANVLLYLPWFERMQYSVKTTVKYSRLDPVDVIVARGRILRIVDFTRGANGVMTFNCVAAAKEIYRQAITGGTAAGQTPGTPTPPQTTDLLMLDIPYITAPDKQQVYYAAMAGSDRRSWLGATLMKSVDGGASWTIIATDPGPGDTFGATLTKLADWTGGNVFDEVNTVTAKLTPGAGELQSYTREQVLNGAGMYLVGDELLQAKNAVLVDVRTYALSGFLRGRNGTDIDGNLSPMARHAINDRFVQLPVRTMLNAEWSEYGAARQYKAITGGSSETAPTGPGTGGPEGPGPPPGALTYHLSWVEPVRIITGAVPDDAVLIFDFTTGSLPTPSSPMNLGRVGGAEWIIGAETRIAVLSEHPGSFTPIIDPGTGLAYPGASSSGNSVSVSFAVGLDSANAGGYYPRLKFGTKYYFNVKQFAPNGDDTEMFIDLARPAGI